MGSWRPVPGKRKRGRGGRSSHLPPAVSLSSLFNVPSKADNGSEGFTYHSTFANLAAFVTSTFAATDSFPSATHQSQLSDLTSEYYDE